MCTSKFCQGIECFQPSEKFPHVPSQTMANPCLQATVVLTFLHQSVSSTRAGHRAGIQYIFVEWVNWARESYGSLHTLKCCQMLAALYCSVQFSRSVERLFVTPWTAARQASLSITNSRCLLKLMSCTVKIKQCLSFRAFRHDMGVVLECRFWMGRSGLGPEILDV